MSLYFAGLFTKKKKHKIWVKYIVIYWKTMSVVFSNVENFELNRDASPTFPLV